MAKKVVKKAAPKKDAPKKSGKAAPKKPVEKNNENKIKEFEGIIEKEADLAIQPLKDLIKKYADRDLGFKVFVIDHKNGFIASLSEHVSPTGEMNIAKKAGKEAEDSLTELMLGEALRRVQDRKKGN